ncbi:hypothetical protein [Kitasatospora sp. NPDC087271]|uniref:hypothetical protein n=1 Tax=Kitasatospora sp. NPDC087271 TaxID=3364067 RepID=UPI0037FCE601
MISQINSVAKAVSAVAGTAAVGCGVVGALPCAAVAGGISQAAWVVSTVTEAGLAVDKCSGGSTAWDCGKEALYLTGYVFGGSKAMGALRGVLPARTDKGLDV